MKPFAYFFMLSALLLAGCGTLHQSREEKEAEARRVAELVNRQLDKGVFQIDVNYMIPLRGAGRSVSGGYSVKVDGAVIDSHLPYAGVARSVPYGGGKVLTFQDDIDAYSDKGWKKGQRTIILSTDNDEDTIVYTLAVSESGYADIHVSCRNRDDISYRGILVIPEEPAE